MNSIGDIRLLGLFDQMTRIFCTLSIFFTLYGQSFAQDSSAQTLQEADEGLNWDEEVPGYGIKDTNYVLSLFDLADLKETSEKVRIYQHIYETSNQLNYGKGIVNSIYEISMLYHYQLGKPDTADRLYDLTKELAIKHEFRKQELIITSTIAQGQIEFYSGKFEKATDLLLQALDLCDSNYIYQRAVILYTMSSIHRELDEDDMSLNYMGLACEEIDKLPYKNHNDAHMLIDYATELNQNNEIDLALIQIKKARNILDSNSTVNYVESIYWRTISLIQLNLENNSAAIEAANSCYKYAKEGGRLDAHLFSITNYLHVAYETQSTNENFIKTIIDEGDSIMLQLDSEKLSFHYLEKKSNALSHINAWREAYIAFSEYDSIQQIIHQNDITEKSNQLQKEIADLESQKALVAREKELVEQDARLAKSNLYFTVSIFGFLLIITIGLLFFMRYRTKTVLGKLQLENKLLRVQINPHFIYNVLANIKSLIFEAPEKAESYTLTFARLLRKVLEQSREEFIPLSEELQLLQDYVTLQETRLNKEIEYIVELDEDIIANEISIPPLVLQPLVENAVEHGFRNGVQEHYILEIRFILQPKYLEVQVIDNGPGVGNIEKKAKHRSLATQIIRDQIDIFRKTNRSKVFDLIVKKREEIEPGTEGTIAVIRIPFKKR